MNKAKFLVRDYEIDIIPEINYLDLMDGTPDTISFSFVSQEDLSKILDIKEKCEVQVWNLARENVGNISNDLSTLEIEDINYTCAHQIDNIYDIYLDEENVGFLDSNDKKINIEYSDGSEQTFYYDNNGIVYFDLKHHYYMCINSISSDKMSTEYDDNGYMITVSLKEQTVLLKDCIRTDIAISPSLYPQVTDEDGNTINVFQTLADAVKKIVDCHNMCSLNEQIQEVDKGLLDDLSRVACPNLTYRDLSTYSQLYDVFIRIGRIPYYSNGILYGLILEGEHKEQLKDLSEYSSVSSVKEDHANSNIYSSKVYNNLYDKERAVVPQIFTDLIYDINILPLTVINKRTGAKYTVYKAIDGQGHDIPNVYTFNESGITYCITNVYNYSGSKGTKPKYISHTPDGEYIAEISNNIFYIDGNQYEIIYSYKSYMYGALENYENASPSFSFTTIPDVESENPITHEVTYMVADTAISNWADDEFKKWTLLNSQNENDVSKTLLYVSGFDENAHGIEDARNYSLELPYQIEDVLHIYKCVPAVSLYHDDVNHESKVAFGFRLEAYDDDRFVETSIYNNLSTLQKRTVAYYTRGEKKINNVVCLNVTSDNDWNILTPELSAGDTQNTFPWSGIKLYNQLKSQFYVVEYKPILNTYYTNYDYCKDDDIKPVAINNFNLPYSQISDKQVYPVMEYNLQKGLDTQQDIKIMTDDLSILNATAGSICKYQGKEYLINKVQFYINNVTVEASFTLTNRIIQNSLLSSYIDNVRVSSVISAESTVDRPIHLFGENKIKLTNYYNEASLNRASNNTNFITDIGNQLSLSGLSDLGLYTGAGSFNIYSYVSKYPFRFDHMIKEYVPSSDNNIKSYVIKLSTGYANVDDNANHMFEFTENDFPLTLEDKCVSNSVYPLTVYSGEFNPSSIVIVNDIDALQSELKNRQYFRTVYKLSGATRSFTCLTIKKNGSNTRYDLYPPIDDNFRQYWRKVQSKFGTTWWYPMSEYNPRIGNYRLYEKGKEYNTTLYGTEKLMTTTGLITKLEYSFVNSSYATNVMSADVLNVPVGSISNEDKSYAITPSILSTTPCYFNRLNRGCIAQGFGNKESDFNSIHKLNDLFNKGYYLDLRENPRPYIQYKTIFRGDNDIIAMELNDELPFMTMSIRYVSAISPINRFYILKIPKFKSISYFNWEEYETMNNFVNENKYCDISGIPSITSSQKMLMNCSKTLIRSDKYDYCLVGANYDAGNNKINNVINYMKFNIKEGSQGTDKLCLDYEIISEM